MLAKEEYDKCERLNEMSELFFKQGRCLYGPRHNSSLSFGELENMDLGSVSTQ